MTESEFWGALRFRIILSGQLAALGYCDWLEVKRYCIGPPDAPIEGLVGFVGRGPASKTYKFILLLPLDALDWATPSGPGKACIGEDRGRSECGHTSRERARMIKRNRDDIASFSPWRRKHLYRLQLWLPSVVVESDRRLGYVLLHGEDTTGWKPDWLAQDEALAFLSFLEKDFSDDPTGYYIFPALRKRAAR